ncbi:outer membrane receptor for ferrienterochelin and colicins [Desulfobotulus alkaliphilus]|uniref:Outer membrane receptor for ferrienterochelin and colicins n=1 Tax=Desulfobotulus alkaliphilus TaxID=622671 RepID=A0A562S8I9_9BACT|nr:TonB-dependent receptor [Desulfobotulus alkaliphilus]TWI76736.1 outer membrane receptor for ferrienterochelin and colicins [Desulfobotulus alkaliphilus]
MGKGKKHLRSAALMSALLFAFQGAKAAEDDHHMGQMVVTASGFEQKITDAPASISVITREELSMRPYISLLDAVRDIEGVDVGETTDKTGQGTISIRGMGAAYTLVLIDGRRQNNVGDLYPNNFGGNQFNHIPPLDMIERIEVIRGPMSTLYGADALGGVINIITRRVSDRWTGSYTHTRTFEQDSDFGNDSTTDFMMMGPLVKDRLGLSLRGSLYERDASSPSYDPATDPSGVVHDRTLGFGGGGRTVDNTNWNAGLRLTYTPNEQHDIIADIDSSRQKYANSEGQLGTLDDYGTILRAANNGIVQPRVGYAADQRFERDQWALTHVGRWGTVRSEVSVSSVNTSNLGRSLPFTVSERAELQELWDAACVASGGSGGCSPASMGLNNNWNEEQKLKVMEGLLTADEMARLKSFLPRDRRTMETRQRTLDAKMDMMMGNHMLVFGGQYVDAEMEDGVFGMYGDGYRSGQTQDHRQWALFLEDSWRIGRMFTLVGGIRYDDHNMYGGQLSPRLYGIMDLASSWTLKGGVSTGYKTPTTDQLFSGITGFTAQGVNPTVGNPDLEPEKSVNSEVAVYYTSPLGHSFNVTAFYNRFKDKIARGDSVPNCEVAAPGEHCVNVGEGWADLGYTSFTQTLNIDRADIQGLELAGRYQITEDMLLKANYTYTDSEQKSGAEKGRPLTGTAEHMVNAGFDWRLLADLNVFFGMEMRSKRYRGWDTEADKARYWKDYEIYHVGGVYKLNEYATLTARVNNLFDRDFTSYGTDFTQNPDGSYTASYTDDYNIKAKARNLWVSLNVIF